MSARADLPLPRRHQGDDAPYCPWCLSAMEDLFVKFEDFEVSFDPPSACDVTVKGDCPNCCKPVRVTQYHRPHFMTGETAGERTDADRKYVDRVTGAVLSAAHVRPQANTGAT